MKLRVFQCRQCGTVLFPARYFCPHCGAGDWDEQVAATGTIEEVTVVRHRVGAQHGDSAYLATVRTIAGPRVIARLDAEMSAGDRVRLELDDDMRILGYDERTGEEHART